MLDWQFTLILGSYLFTAANFSFTFWVYRQAANHLKTRVERLESVLRDMLPPGSTD